MISCWPLGVSRENMRSTLAPGLNILEGGREKRIGVGDRVKGGVGSTLQEGVQAFLMATAIATMPTRVTTPRIKVSRVARAGVEIPGGFAGDMEEGVGEMMWLVEARESVVVECVRTVEVGTRIKLVGELGTSDISVGR